MGTRLSRWAGLIVNACIVVPLLQYQGNAEPARGFDKFANSFGKLISFRVEMETSLHRIKDQLQTSEKDSDDAKQLYMIARGRYMAFLAAVCSGRLQGNDLETSLHLAFDASVAASRWTDFAKSLPTKQYLPSNWRPPFLDVVLSLARLGSRTTQERAVKPFCDDAAWPEWQRIE
jgi:hypothetical protein